jgi:hypothetical protein
MADAIAHRGPDGASQYDDARIGRLLAREPALALGVLDVFDEEAARRREDEAFAEVLAALIEVMEIVRRIGGYMPHGDLQALRNARAVIAEHASAGSAGAAK